MGTDFTISLPQGEVVGGDWQDPHLWGSDPSGRGAPGGETDGEGEPSSHVYEDLITPEIIVPRTLLRAGGARGGSAARHAPLQPEGLLEIEWDDGLVELITAQEYKDRYARGLHREVRIAEGRAATRVFARAYQALRIRFEDIAALVDPDARHGARRKDRRAALERVRKLLAQARDRSRGELLDQSQADWTPILQGLVLPLIRSLERMQQRHDRAADMGTEGRLYRVDEDGSLHPWVSEPLAGRALLLIHGTWSPTEVGFAGLIEDGETWRGLRAAHPGGVLAFQHPALSRDPIDNALTLAKLLPQGAELNVISHSRGGLVGELLCAPWEGPEVARVLELGGPAGAARVLMAQARQKAEELALVVEGIEIHRFVRVACPMRGTLLASSRLDRTASLTLTALRLAAKGIPVLRQTLVFARTVLRVLLSVLKDPRLVPGLAAMVPASPLVLFLNHPRRRRESTNRLAIVAGGVEVGGGIARSLVALAAHLYYREQHDLVVHTQAMYGGVPREEPPQALLRTGPQFTHNAYFHNPATRAPIVPWLQGRHTKAFVPIDPVTEPVTGDRGLARRLGSLEQGVADSRRPRSSSDPEHTVILVPGVMGSHLEHIDSDGTPEHVWFQYESLFSAGSLALDDHLGDTRRWACQSVLAAAYGDIHEFLSTRFRVRVFPYDWRLSTVSHSERLRALFESELDSGPGRVHLLAHSMGGLVCRSFIAEHGKLWKRARARGSRLLMAGTPNRGAPAVLRMVELGRHSVLDILNPAVWTRWFFTGQEPRHLRSVVRKLPGALEMMPWDWSHLYDRRSSIWARAKGRPPAEEALLAAKAVQEELEGSLPALVEAGGLVYLAGHARLTVVGRTEAGRFEQQLDRGDGSVLWSGGIPEGVEPWFVKASHDQLLNHRPAFEEICQLLATGSCTPRSLSRSRPSSSTWFREGRPLDSISPVVLEDSEDTPTFLATRRDLARALGGDGTMSHPQVREPMLTTVVHGDVSAARWPVVIGVYEGMAPGGVVRALDRALDGRLLPRLRQARFEGALGETCSLLRRQETETIRGALVVGLGPAGRLGPTEVRDAVSRAATLLLSTAIDEDEQVVGMSVTLLGSHGALTVSQSVRAVVQGAMRASDAFRRDSSPPEGEPGQATARAWGGGADLVELEIMEIYEDIAIQAQHELLHLPSDATPGCRTLFLEALPQLRSGHGALHHTRPLPYESAWPYRISVHLEDEDLVFEVFAHRARGGRHTSKLRWKALGQMVERATWRSTSRQRASPDLGRSLYKNVIPPQLQHIFEEGEPIQLILDEAASRLPWELFQDDRELPLAVRFPLTRQLVGAGGRHRPEDSTGEDVLILADLELVHNLDQARYEARSLEELFEGASWDVRSIVGHDHELAEILEETRTSPPVVLHMATHGILEDGLAKIVMGDDRDDPEIFVGPDFFGTLEPVPRIVFLNACHSGAQGAIEPAESSEFASTIAHSLLGAGVQAVVVAGWPVDDRAAKDFALIFWRSMLEGRVLGDAVLDARVATYQAHPTCNTWAAYQVYGEPSFRLHVAVRRPAPLVAAAELMRELTMLRQRGPMADTDALERLIAQAPRGWLDGEAQELIGDIYLAVGAHERAAEHYQDALTHGNDASLRAAEQLVLAWSRHLRTLPDAEAQEAFETLTLLREASDGAPHTERKRLWQPRKARAVLRERAHLAPSPRCDLLLGRMWEDHARRHAPPRRLEHLQTARFHYEAARIHARGERLRSSISLLAILAALWREDPSWSHVARHVVRPGAPSTSEGEVFHRFPEVFGAWKGAEAGRRSLGVLRQQLEDGGAGLPASLDPDAAARLLAALEQHLDSHAAQHEP